MERVQKSIEQQRNMVCYCRNGIKKTEEVLKMLVAALHVLHLGVNPHTILAIDPAIVLQNIKNDLTNIIAEVQTLQKQISVSKSLDRSHILKYSRIRMDC